MTDEERRKFLDEMVDACSKLQRDTPRSLFEKDMALYGKSFVRINADGRAERLDPRDVYIAEEDDD
jgi:hypothetical protein